MDSDKSLNELRQQIDEIDQEILARLNGRALLAVEVAKIKAAGGETKNFYRPEREAFVLRKIKGANKGPLSDELVLHVFRELMSACLALEKPVKVARVVQHLDIEGDGRLPINYR